MTRALMRRLGKLEQTMTTTAEARTGKGHWLISEKGEDLEPRRQRCGHQRSGRRATTSLIG